MSNAEEGMLGLMNDDPDPSRGQDEDKDCPFYKRQAAAEEGVESFESSEGTNKYNLNPNIALDPTVAAQRELRRDSQYYFTLSMDITFEYDNDTVFLAYTYPYTYTMLKRMLRTLEKRFPDKAHFMKRSSLCQTLGGADCDLLSISNWDPDLPGREHKKYSFYHNKRS